MRQNQAGGANGQNGKAPASFPSRTREHHIADLSRNYMIYGRLEQVLAEWGVSRTEKANFVAFRHEPCHALIVLPITEKEETVSFWHLASVQKAVSEKHITQAAMSERMKAAGGRWPRK